jgi:hypothetical protein
MRRRVPLLQCIRHRERCAPKEAGTLAATKANFEQAAVVSPSRLINAERREILMPARGTHR